jgi:glucokinase
VDVGGTKIAAGLVDSDGVVSGLKRFSTDTRSPQAAIRGIADAVTQTIAAAGIDKDQVRGVGLGIPGLVDPETGMGIASVNMNWSNVPVRAELEALLSLPCFIENDVRAAALAELTYGAGRGKTDLIYLSIGTGIASTAILGGKALTGASLLAGEIGHAVLDPSGPACKCGSRGCFEALVAGPAIARRAASRLNEQPSLLSEWGGSHGEQITSEMVFQAAVQCDPLALAVLDETGYWTAFALQFMLLAFNPQIVVLAGGVASAGKLFRDPVIQHLNRLASQSWVLAKTYQPEMIQHTPLSSNVGVLGAAALVVQRL